MGDHGMRDVEVDDATGPAVGGATAVPRLTRRQALLLSAGAAMVAVALVATQAVLDSQDRARIARISALQGALRPVAPLDDEPLRVLTTMTVDGTVERHFFLVADLLLTEQRSGAASTVQATRPGTAAPVWTTTLAEPASNGRIPACALTGPRADPRLLVCLVTGATTPTTDANADTDTSTSVDATTAADRLLVLDPRTGAVRAERAVRSPDGIAAVGDQVVLVEVGPANQAEATGTTDVGDVVVRLTATEPLTGATRWTFTAPGPIDSTLGERGLDSWFNPLTDMALRAGVSIRTLGDDALAVEIPGRGAWVLSGAGEVVARARAEDLEQEVVQPRPGIYAAYRTHAQEPLETMTVLRPDGALGTQLDHPLVTFAVDDGSVPALVFSQGERFPAGTGVLRAWDVGTGASVWVGDEPVFPGLVLLDGVIYGTTVPNSLIALDARTGEAVWTQEVQPPPRSTLTVHTDGSALLVIGASGSDLTLHAFDLHDGRPLWSRPVPGSYDYLTSGLGHLVGYTSDFTTVAVLG